MTPVALTDPIFDIGDRPLSLQDLLDYFGKRGVMRISDLHLKAGYAPSYRVDGELQPMRTRPLTADAVEQAARRLLPPEEYERLATRKAVDGSLIQDKLQFRLNVFRDSDGLCIAIRALEGGAPEVEALGFPNQTWRDILTRQQGLVLVTGITGCGKSTTIASLINRIAHTSSSRIITLEDPIEYRLRGDRSVVSQRELGRDVPSYEVGLRDCLREDPDVIFVGEMRDRDATSWTLTAAETGHLVFSTLHTRDARGTITRILDMYPPDRQEEVASQLSLGLAYVICQKLVPRADGQGRVAVMEIMQNSYAVANLIRLRKVEQLYSVMQTQTKDTTPERMVTLERSLANLVAAGIVEPLEAEKWANHPETFIDEMKHVQEGASRAPKPSRHRGT
jgi:twitching motility protein PilT